MNHEPASGPHSTRCASKWTKPSDQFNHALSPTSSAPKKPAWPITSGFSAVTTGHGVDELCKEFERDHDDYNSIMTKAWPDRLAEAFAECLHKRVRIEWGYGATENLSNEDLNPRALSRHRPAAGYPACPDHTEKFLLWQLLDVEAKTASS